VRQGIGCQGNIQYVRLWEEQHICLVKLINVDRKVMTGKGWQLIGRMLIGEMHHCTFIAAVCMLKQASVPIIPTMFDTVVLTVVTTISVIKLA